MGKKHYKYSAIVATFCKEKLSKLNLKEEIS